MKKEREIIIRAREINAEVLLKASRVSGIYDSDPVKERNAKKFEKLTYLECLNRNLKAMDVTAISFCMEQKLPIIFFDLNVPGNIKRAITGKRVGTIIKG